MSSHGTRTVYYMVGEDDIVDLLCLHTAGCPFSATATAANATAPPKHSPFKFGRLFDFNPCDKTAWPALQELGNAMNAGLLTVPEDRADPNDSNIPAGYTYLGQFIAHEITFDRTKGLQELTDLPALKRTPTLDLDSLYGSNLPDKQRAAMFDGARLKRGRTTAPPFGSFKPLNPDSDLPRGPAAPFKAVLGDERNDENLLLAQTHLAFIKFHNRVVEHLNKNSPTPLPVALLFEKARRTVIRHFQAIILNDYLPRIIDPRVLRAVVDGTIKGGRLLEQKAESKTDGRLLHPAVTRQEELCMPVEFSAAAFRLGHSMVRATYNYNHHHREDKPHGRKPARLDELFKFTQFSGGAQFNGLPGDWIIDWRRFYDFRQVNPGVMICNMAKRINTSFNLHLDTISNYPHNVVEAYKAITIRNLIRGCCLKLPTGQFVARELGEEPMEGTAITDREEPGVQSALKKHEFDKKTPLWFYILKEAKERGEGGHKLGPVGSRIVAETFYAIIRYSEHSILDEHDPLTEAEMLPRRAHDRFDKFDMVDMLTFVGEISPTHLE